MRIQDIADILIMTLLLYQLYYWFRKTRALQVVLGLGSLILLYMVTKSLGLFMTSWVLQELGTVIFVLIIVVFQGEIRQALYRFSMLRNFFDRKDETFSLDIHGVVSTLFSLAERRIGAIVVIERKESLDDYLLHGVQLDSLFSSQLLASIFEDVSPLHDGAVIIRNSRISEASSHLPLSINSELPQYLGTRHRAALGLTEKTDAIVLVVSEERGEVSYVTAGEIIKVGSRDELAGMLEASVVPANTTLPKFSFKERVTRNLLPKFVTFCLVLICWLLINVRQGGVQAVSAQVKFNNLPENLVLKGDLPSEIEVQLKILSTIFTSGNKPEIVADIDLSRIHEGVNIVPVEAKSFRPPLGVSVVKSSPSTLKIVAEKKSYRVVPVHIRKIGQPPKGVKLKSVTVEPASVRVIGSESSLAQIGQVYTEPVDMGEFFKSQIIDVKLVSPSSHVRLSADESVRVKIVVAR